MKTATIPGHKDPGAVYNHYKALVVKSTVLKFWELQPLAFETSNSSKPPEAPQ